MKKSILTLVALSALAGCAPSHQQEDEAIGDRNTLIDEGYKPVPSPAPGAPPLPAPRHSLKWPVTFQDQEHTLGNVMAQYQPYGKAYFRAGNDLRVKAGAAVRAPVDGRVEAGHYSYATNDDGSMDKYWLPWPKSGNALYFEVAVVADDGTRYEFHHVNRKNLPDNIIKLVESGGRVQAGDVVGYTIPWSDGVYHHIHYNVIAANGVKINPEYISEAIPDARAPEIKGTYAVMPSGAVQDFGSGRFTERPREFVVAVVDRKDRNIYVHPPTWIRLQFTNGEKFEWDFRQTLTKEDGTWPALWDFFAKSIRTPQGSTIQTSGGYGTGLSLIRLKVPAQAAGDFTIEVGDVLENTTTLEGRIESSAL